MLPRKRRRTIILVLAVAAAAMALCALLWRGPDSCEREYDAIEEEVRDANYCSADSDCKLMPLGGELIRFGCFHYVNRQVDQSVLLGRMMAYWNRCSRVIDDCAEAPNATCVSGKCVPSSG